MADDDDSSNISKSYRPQETFQRIQETQVEHRFPSHPTGVVPLPRGSRGARSLYLHRNGKSFGFTLRHFIVYPPDSVAESDKQNVVSLTSPVETIFVKKIIENGPAEKAGLQCGDRILAVNNVNILKKSYQEVVQLIANSPAYLHLLVVPKEDDILQQLFTEAAHNPATNQRSITSTPQERRIVRRLISSQRGGGVDGGGGGGGASNEFQVDAISWRSIQNPYGLQQQKAYYYERGQRSADNLLLNEERNLYQTKQQQQQQSPQTHEFSCRERYRRAEPQVPSSSSINKMGRRASSGSSSFIDSTTTTTTTEQYSGESPDYCSIISDSDTNSDYNMKTMYSQDITYQNQPGCRLSLDMNGRESTGTSLSSIYAADGSLCDSASTLTDLNETALNRIRRNTQKKEEFLRTPIHQTVQQREFYGQPKKFEPVWPPNNNNNNNNNNEFKTSKPTHQNFIRVKNYIESERELQQQIGNSVIGEQQRNNIKSPIDKKLTCNKLFEAATPPEMYDGMVEAAVSDDRRLYPPVQQIVHRRARDFESGRPLPDDEPLSPTRTDLSRSELARLSSKHLVPNVTERAQEYEIRSTQPKKETKRIQRDSRSLDSAEYKDNTDTTNRQLSGNVTISSGSKYIHCPPPSSSSNENDDGKPTETPVNEAIKYRARSNSAESWSSALKLPEDGPKRHSSVHEERNQQKEYEAMEVCTPHTPLIPVPVEQINLTPTVSITPAPTNLNLNQKLQRPTQLNLDGPVRPNRHLKPPTLNIETPIRRSVSPVTNEDKPIVVKRRTKTTNIADDERSTRRESYLKATEGGRMHIDSDLSDGDSSPHNLRSGSASGNSSSSASLDHEKPTSSPLEKENIIREGSVHCKILEIDGKRSADRSWKQAWIVLKGPNLYLLKDRHHQSPIGTSDSLDQSLSNGIDMRSSTVRIAEDYTKRKNVLRISSIKPCRSEFLLQADNSDEFNDWVKTLQQQVETSSSEQNLNLSPQFNKSKSSASRNRSPTGQSPVSKSRKPSQILEPPTTSPKTKTWRGRMAKQLRKIQGTSSPSSPTAPEGSTFGIPLDQCLPSLRNPFVPRFVEVCTDIVDERGLKTVGIYRVPGNNASITALTDEINRNYDEIPQDDQRWNDLHVVSSLLKSYLRKMPDSLITCTLYPKFIRADKIDDTKQRMEELKKLIKSLPPHNYHTLKHVIGHLNRVVENSEINLMEAKNLAIVFGPTIVRPDGSNMESLVNDMTNQCKIVETLLNGAEWFFSENDNELPVPVAVNEEFEQANQALLLDNISKYEALKDPKEKNGALFSSIISAAARVKKRATTTSQKSSTSSFEKSETTSPTSPKLFTASNDLKESTTLSKQTIIPTTVTDMENKEKQQQQQQTPSWLNYAYAEQYRQRVKNFEQETEAMLHRPRPTEISINFADLSNNDNFLRTPRQNEIPLQKTLSASNVYSQRNLNNKQTTQKTDTSRNSLNVQYNHKNHLINNSNNRECNNDWEATKLLYSASGKQLLEAGANNLVFNSEKKKAKNDCLDGVVRRGNSVENLNNELDINANGHMKKIKYENENEGTESSLNSLTTTDEETDLTTAITKIFNQKLKETNILSGENLNLPFVDESPEKQPRDINFPTSNKENCIPDETDLYKNPSLHKTQYNTVQSKYYKFDDFKLKESKIDKEKDEDTMTTDNVPDNERHLQTTKLPLVSNKLNITTNSKLKRSESLNKPERTVSPLKLKRSESLNKPTSDQQIRLKRSDSLTKTEKTENNLNKRRELSRAKEMMKNKRKNGMPDRSIKRRHTVGGTKDPDKVTWYDNKYQEEFTSTKENQEKNLRTSSPDLSSTRRERLYEINLIGTQNMVVTLRQHLIGNSGNNRPQSFPETFKVPLESHV